MSINDDGRMANGVAADFATSPRKSPRRFCALERDFIAKTAILTTIIMNAESNPGRGE
jgi:hypothetical protein